MNILEKVTKIIDVILEIIFPPSRREKSLENIKIENMPVEPEVQNACEISITSLMSYNNKVVCECIRTLKFEGSARAAILCAGVLDDFLLEEIANNRTFSSADIMLVPVPLGKKRERERGYNQTALVLAELKKRAPDIVVKKNMLVRTRETKPQMSLPRDARLKNVKSAFALNTKSRFYKNALALPSPQNTHIILVDDVTTTGATLSAAALPIKERGYRVTALALSRA